MSRATAATPSPLCSTGAYRADKPDAGRLEIEANDRFAHQAPELIVVLSSPIEATRFRSGSSSCPAARPA